MPELKKDLLGLKFSSPIDISGVQEEVINLSLDAAGSVESSLTGTVTDGLAPVENATVKIFDQDGNPYKHAVTNKDGKYLFDSVAVGTYNVAVAAVDYRLCDCMSVTLTEGETTTLPFSITKDSTLTLGVVTGIVSTLQGARVTPLSGVKMSLIDEVNNITAVTYTVSDGEYAFYDITNGNYTLQATNEGYIPSDPISITITDKASIKKDFGLNADAPTDSGTINGLITDSLDQPVVGGFVGLYQITTHGQGQQEETLISHTKTNAQGKYLFGNLAEGQYVIKAKMNA